MKFFFFVLFLFRYSLSHSFSFVISTDLATVTAFLGAIRAATSAQMNKNTRCLTYSPTTPRHKHTHIRHIMYHLIFMLCRLLWCMRRGGFIRCTSSLCLMISNNRKKNRNRSRLPWHKMRKRNDCCHCQHWLNAYQSGCCFALNSSGARCNFDSYVELSRAKRRRERSEHT